MDSVRSYKYPKRDEGNQNDAFSRTEAPKKDILETSFGLKNKGATICAHYILVMLP